ncbi:MAG: DUF3786 domain-containing protein [Candidatus Nezhaarchaeota archaeon]|nr:DUF3786 domain-containing protein [Candidatus Nezhaarchaeota archaeon]
MQLKPDLRDRVIHLLGGLSKKDENAASRAVNGKAMVDDVKALEFTVLGAWFKVELQGGTLKVNVVDPLNREEDSSRLLGYALNFIERAVRRGTSLRAGKGLVGLLQLPGGSTVRLYEKKAIDFLTVEVEGSTLDEVERAVKHIGGGLVEHLNATWSFEVSPFNGLRVRVAYWQGEEEIPSGAAILLGEEVKDLEVPIEEVITLVEMTVNRFVLFYRKETGRQPRLFHSLYL